MTQIQDEWLWGWDRTQGIVSVWADSEGHATVWRRDPMTRALLREEEVFRPWILLSSLVDLQHLGPRLQRESADRRPGGVSYQELEGEGGLRYLVRADDGRALARAVLQGASRRLSRKVGHLRELGAQAVLALPPEEQYLVATGRTYFKALPFDAVRRLQFDLETTGLAPEDSRIFLVALRSPEGKEETLEALGAGDEAEARLLQELCERIRELDPDIIENHNLHGFDVPFLVERARRLGVTLLLARNGEPGLRQRPAARGAALAPGAEQSRPGSARRSRYTMAGRELIDSLDAVRRHDFSARDLPGHGLKAVARHLGLASEEREYVPGARVHQVFLDDPARVRRYAKDDVREAAGVSRLLGGAAFALAQMAPRRYERLSDAGAATGVLDPMLVRAYLRSGAALPVHQAGDGTQHQGAALHLFACGVAHRIVKADVASLYPSLMRQYRIGPKRDRLGALLALVEQLVEQRLSAKARARAAAPGSEERFSQEAISAAMKLVVNSAYGYLGAVGLTRFADVNAANEVTRRGREVLELMCRELSLRSVQLLEADTDGVYFSVRDGTSEADERRLVAEVAALLPPLVKLEFDGRYAAMLSHEPKNYALKPYSGPLLLRGVAFRSSRAEPFGEAFLRQAIDCLLAGDLLGVREVYVTTARAIQQRTLSTFAMTARVRLSKTPEQYLATRAQRRELGYEALLENGHDRWALGDRIRVYRAARGRAGLLSDREATDTDANATSDPRDYDVDYYLRLLRDTYAARLARGLSPDDFAAICAAPEQPSLFERSLAEARPVLTILENPFSQR
ncbi:MAG TPA: DNA polymerase domain-containing protein [Polyangiaceae bacterium]|nr:DNA polymerase domain-containing protein [Polyangiaceae bacterium]